MRILRVVLLSAALLLAAAPAPGRDRLTDRCSDTPVSLVATFSLRDDCTEIIEVTYFNECGQIVAQTVEQTTWCEPSGSPSTTEEPNAVS